MAGHESSSSRTSCHDEAAAPKRFHPPEEVPSMRKRCHPEEVPFSERPGLRGCPLRLGVGFFGVRGSLECTSRGEGTGGAPARPPTWMRPAPPNTKMSISGQASTTKTTGLRAAFGIRARFRSRVSRFRRRIAPEGLEGTLRRETLPPSRRPEASERPADRPRER